jgi:hypothetical protein
MIGLLKTALTWMVSAKALWKKLHKVDQSALEPGKMMAFLKAKGLSKVNGVCEGTNDGRANGG